MTNSIMNIEELLVKVNQIKGSKHYHEYLRLFGSFKLHLMSEDQLNKIEQFCNKIK